MIRAFLIVMLLLSFEIVDAQPCVQKSLSYLNDYPLPWVAKKGITYKRYGICNPNGIIPNRLYNNIQGTDYWLATDPELNPAVFAKFSVPDIPYTLAAVVWGGATDWNATVLISVDKDGVIKSTLEVGYSWAWIAPKQFQITKDCKVIVSTLTPVSSASLPFNSFTQFEGYITDVTYVLNTSGVFVKESTSTRDRRVYTRAELDTKTFNLF